MKKFNFRAMSVTITLSSLLSVIVACVPVGGVGSSSGGNPSPTVSPSPTTSPTPASGWSSTVSAPTVYGRANNIGFASDQLGNLYLSYQGESSFTVYRYQFNQTTPQWQQIASTQNMSVSSFYSSVAISAINTINLMYLYSPDYSTRSVIHYLTALPDKIDFSSVSIPRTNQSYSYSGTKSPTPACPAPIVHDLTGSEASMALDTADKQVIAFSDTLQYDKSEVSVESGTCVAPAYNGASRLSVYFDNNYTTYKQLSDGTATQIKIAGTPTRVGNLFPIYVAFKDGANSGISVEKIMQSGESYTFSYVGNKAFNGSVANYIALAVDKNSVPYVAYESDNQLLYVQKYNGSSWTIVGSGNTTTGISTWISLAIDQKTNMPYVAYQEGSYIKVKRFDGTSWIQVGSDLTNTPNNYGAYTNIIMRQTTIDTWQPTIAFQATPPSMSSSSLSVMYYTGN